MKNVNKKVVENKVTEKDIKKEVSNMKTDKPVVEAESEKTVAEIIEKSKKEVKEEMPKAEKTVKVEEVTIEKVEKVAEEKKVATKKTSKKKVAPIAEVAVKVELQYAGESYDMIAVENKVKEMFKDAKEIAIYVKPEEKMVYYVVDGETGNVEL